MIYGRKGIIITLNWVKFNLIIVNTTYLSKLANRYEEHEMIYQNSL